MSDSLLLPEGSRLLHIGPHKTGSTAIQVSLFAARDSLDEHGVYYPSRARRRRQASEELFRAAKGARLDDPLPLWDALVAEVAGAGDQRVCVSDELFGKASRETVAKIVRDLGDERAHVVAVARPLDSYLPSQWQERVKAGRPESLDDWLRIVLGDHPDNYENRNVWHAHDTRALVERWLEFVDPQRFTLIVADESDRARLPRLFASMLGVPDEVLKLAPDRSNESLVLAEVELIRVVNQALIDAGRTVREFQPWLKNVIRAAGAHQGARPGPRKSPLPDWAVARVKELSDARVDAVRALPVRIVGDPEWLRASDAAEVPRPDASDLVVSAELAGAAVARVVASALNQQA